MRLSTLNAELDKQFKESKDLKASRIIFENIFNKCLENIDVNIFMLIENDVVRRELISGFIPRGYNFKLMGDEFDNKYFDCEDAGNFIDSSKYFSLARIMFSLYMYESANTNEDYSEAAYEIVMSQSSPRDFSLKNKTN